MRPTIALFATACLGVLCLSGCKPAESRTLSPARPEPLGSVSSAAIAPVRSVPAVASNPAGALPSASAGEGLIPDSPVTASSHTGACPPEMVQVGRACVDRWEAHLIVRTQDGKERALPHYERPPQDVHFIAKSTPNSFPQAYISRVEAESACVAAGKRLCSLNEWYHACLGPQNQMYSYGPEEIRGKCNTAKPHLLSRFYGTNPNAWKYDKHFNDPKLDQEPGFLGRTGSYSECVSGYGVYDMVGNLHEWISDPVSEDLETALPLRDDVRKKVPLRKGNGIFMGGFFSTTNEHGKGCAFVTIGHEPRYHDYSTGFRCCMDAPGKKSR